VCSQTFDHTSILQFLEARFGVEASNISAWRRAVCGDLTSAFDFAGEPDMAQPEFHVPAPHTAHKPITVPTDQAMPAQEPGLRPARALPYAWTVDHGRQPGSDRFWIEFSNAGEAGAAFYVYDKTDPAGFPRRFTVAAGEAVRDYWPLSTDQARYDALVHGPNGYLFHARGQAADPAVEVWLRPDPAHQRVRLVLTNAGRPCVAAVREAYTGATVNQRLAPGAHVESTLDIGASSGWHDISVTLDDAGCYLRRYAGHIENDQPSSSDPQRHR
jgi:phospholipase C